MIVQFQQKIYHKMFEKKPFIHGPSQPMGQTIELYWKWFGGMAANFFGIKTVAPPLKTAFRVILYLMKKRFL